MATVYGNTTNHWRAYFVFETTETATEYTINVTQAGFQSVGYGFQIYDAISSEIYVNDQLVASGSGDFYSPNGTTVSTSYATATHTVKKTTAAQAVTIKVVTRNVSGFMDGTSTASVVGTVPALANYAVTYDANGGEGAPSGHTKWYGQPVVLSTTRPTRTGYTFLGWGTSAGATSTSYQPGATYTANADVVLYAVWKLDYIRPNVSGLRAYRCGSDGTLDDEGTYARVTCSWSVDTTLNASAVATSVKVEYKLSTATSWTTAKTTNPGTASGTVDVVIGGSLSADYAYDVRVTVADSGGSTPANTLVTAASFPIDVGNMGGSIGLFCSASDTETGLDVGDEARFHGNVVLNDSATPVHTRLQALEGATRTDAAYVTEVGTLNGWDYRKWSDGTAECWASKEFPGQAVTGSYGNAYFVNKGTDLPFTFAEIPHLQISIRTGSGGLLGASFTSDCTPSKLGWFIYSMRSESSLDISVQLYARGTLASV